MRGLLLTALILAGLDLVLTSQASRIPAALAPVSNGIANWLDPAVPLISAGKLTAASSTGAAASQPGRKKAVAGTCPPGWLPDLKHPGHCIQTLP